MLPIYRTTHNDWMTNFFDTFFNDGWGNTQLTRKYSQAPAINVAETETEYNMDVAAPGMNKEDFKLQLVDNDKIILSLEKKNETADEDAKRYLRREFCYSKYEQTFTLPKDVNRTKINATMTDGVLHIALPKYTADEMPKAAHFIEIQ